MFDYIDRGKQLILFDGISYGKTSPTDLDGFYDLRGRGCVVFELKHRSKDCPQGQRIAMEYIIKCMRELGKPSIAIIAEHFVDDALKDVIAKDAIVREFFSTISSVWLKSNGETKLGDFVDLFITNYHEEFLKSVIKEGG